MERQQIHEKIQAEINNWQETQQLRYKPVLTSHAFNFLVEVVDNIRTDPSKSWRIPTYDDHQERAVALIPKALSDVYRSYPHYQANAIPISTWELWHSMSQILHTMCFIPKDV